MYTALSLSARSCESTRRALHVTSTRQCVSVAWKSLSESIINVDKVGGKYLMSLIPGVGGSDRLVETLASVLLCSGAPLTWEVIPGNFNDDVDFENLVISIKRNGIAVKGNMDPYERADITTKRTRMTRSMTLRRTLDLHAFIMEIKSFEGLKPLMKVHKNIDVTVFRQNTEGDYMLLEHSPMRDESVVELLRVITRNNSERLAESAFQYARSKKRKRVQCLHRYGILPLSEGIFIDGFTNVAKRYPDIKHEVMEFRKAFWYFMKDPKFLDVIVTNGLDGLMLSNYLFGILGSPNLVAGMNFGNNSLVLEPASRQRDTEPNPNPTAYFLCGAALLDFLGHRDYAENIRQSIEETFLDKILTADLGGTATLFEFTDEVIKRLRRRKPHVRCSFDPPPTNRIKTEPISPFKPKPPGTL